MKKIKISSEFMYVAALFIMSFSVAMVAAADFGVSMIVAPAFIVSEKVPFLTFGQAEYVVQGLLFIVFCILMKGLKPIYLGSFATGLVYGALLDLWRMIIPHFNPTVFAPGSFSMPLRIAYLAVGMTLTSISVAMFFKTYLYPQVYDFFVKGVCEKYSLNRSRFKICFDFACLAIALALSFILFGRLVGIGIGTVIMTCLNGLLIGAFDKALDCYFEIKPHFTRFAKIFEIA